MKENDALVFRVIQFLRLLPPKDKPNGVYSYLVVIASFQNEKINTPCFASQQTIANEIGLSKKTITRIQSYCKKRGLITVTNKFEKKHQKTNHISVNENYINSILKAAGKFDSIRMSTLGGTERLIDVVKMTHNKNNYKNKDNIIYTKKELTNKQKDWINKLASDYIRKQKKENGQYYDFDTLVSELEIFLKGDQTEEHWVKIGNGIPLNEIIPQRM